MFYYSKLEATMSKVRLVVVGNGMVGHRFIEELIERADPGRYGSPSSVQNPVPPTIASISSYFSHHTSEDLSLVKPGFYDKHGIRLLLGESGEKKIDRANREVHSNKGTVVGYDKLVLATGSTLGAAHPGQPAPRVLRLSHHRGSESHPQRRQERQERVVIGGGLLGLEAAGALKALGRNPRGGFAPVLMAEQLDGQGGQLLRRKIESMGVQVHTSKSTSEI